LCYIITKQSVIIDGKIIKNTAAFLTMINSDTSPYRQKNKEYRLPTTIEWEYAARGGIYRRSLLGEDDYIYAGFNPDGTNVLTDYAWCTYNSSGRPHEVGRKLGNELGLYDMSGNIWEWTYTTYREVLRVIRGGCWFDAGYDCRVSFWDDGAPEGGYSNVGFRLAF